MLLKCEIHPFNSLQELILDLLFLFPPDLLNKIMENASKFVFLLCQNLGIFAELLHCLIIDLLDLQFKFLFVLDIFFLPELRNYAADVEETSWSQQVENFDIFSLFHIQQVIVFDRVQDIFHNKLWFLGLEIVFLHLEVTRIFISIYVLDIEFHIWSAKSDEGKLFSFNTLSFLLIF